MLFRSINGNQNVTIPFTTGQLNDVLKSLTVLDLNGGRIGGITYDSAAPTDRQMADLRNPGTSMPTAGCTPVTLGRWMRTSDSGFWAGRRK